MDETNGREVRYVRASPGERVLGSICAIDGSNGYTVFVNQEQEIGLQQFDALINVTMSRLAPVMSSIFMSVHLPVGSTSQAMGHAAPSL